MKFIVIIVATRKCWIIVNIVLPLMEWMVSVGGKL